MKKIYKERDLTSTYNKYKIFLYIIKRTPIVDNNRLETALYNVKTPKTKSKFTLLPKRERSALFLRLFALDN